MAETARDITLDELIALNDEIAALVRAGVPLERGLAGMARDLPGRMGDLAAALGERLDRGQSLAEALDDQKERFPPVYRAVVTAGCRAGELSAALESLATVAHHLVDLRRAIAAASVYPLLVILVTYGLFLPFVIFLAPYLQGAYKSFELPAQPALRVVTDVAPSAAYWGPALPVVLVLLAMVWSRSARTRLFEPAWSNLLLCWVPGARGLVRNSRLAGFAELLGLLVEQGAPLHEALPLAASCTGDAGLIAAAERLAGELERGQTPQRGLSHCSLPAFLTWSLTSNQRQQTMVSLLRSRAESYRQRVRRRAELIQIFLPVLAVLLVGVLTASLYIVTVVWPWTGFLKGLALG